MSKKKQIKQVEAQIEEVKISPRQAKANKKAELKESLIAIQGMLNNKPSEKQRTSLLRTQFQLQIELKNI
tara:strand:+ start:41 stop:250 length:210 start_codon:yes stop_codon:yes gene_type:complete